VGWVAEGEGNETSVCHLAEKGCISFSVKPYQDTIPGQKAWAMLEQSTGYQDELLSASVAVPAFFNLKGHRLFNWVFLPVGFSLSFQGFNA